MEDLYELTSDMLLKNKGNTLLKKYDNSVVQLVMGVFPQVLQKKKKKKKHRRKGKKEQKNKGKVMWQGGERRDFLNRVQNSGIRKQTEIKERERRGIK
jgi:hypothetical protein